MNYKFSSRNYVCIFILHRIVKYNGLSVNKSIVDCFSLLEFVVFRFARFRLHMLDFSRIECLNFKTYTNTDDNYNVLDQNVCC